MIFLKNLPESVLSLIVLNLNAAIKQYCQPPLCPSCELSVVLVTQRCVQGQFFVLERSVEVFKKTSDQRIEQITITNLLMVRPPCGHPGVGPLPNIFYVTEVIIFLVRERY